MESEIKKTRLDDDIYICRSDLLLVLAKLQNSYRGLANSDKAQAVNDMILLISK